MVVAAIVPVVLILALGSFLRRRVLTDPTFRRGAEWLSYFVFTPALFVESITQTSHTEISPVPLLLSLGIPVPTVSVLLLAQPARAIGTLVSGAAITVRMRLRDGFRVALASTIKLLALPLSATALVGSFGLGAAASTAVVLICVVPTAPSAYILASRMGGDSQLMASITGVQTVLSTATLPLILHATPT